MNKNILSALAVCAVIFGCHKNEIPETVSSGDDLRATIKNEIVSKTVLDENNNIRWSEGDQIVAFMKTSLGLRYQVKDSYIGQTYGCFSKVSSEPSDDLRAGMEWSHIVAYYPYSETISCARYGENYVIGVGLPSEQFYAQDSFGNTAFPMVAVSEDNDITFKNVGGGMKLLFKGTLKVKFIRLEGNNDEKLSGEATVTAYTDGESSPTIIMSDAASTSVTLNCGSGIQLNENTATEFIIALPPVVFSKGFVVTVIDTEGNEQTIETDKENNVLRSSLLVMPEVKLSQLIDYVDEYNINHGKGTRINGVVWAPVNCGYHKDDYKYGKLYQWGRKYGQGYSILSDASIPEIVEGPISVESVQDRAYSNTFFKVQNHFCDDWASSQDDELWNSGTESNPVKTECDPCPKGWRVPTGAELTGLISHHSKWTTNEFGQYGYWFSGTNAYSSDVPKLFLSSAGIRSYNDGIDTGRDIYGYYWSSTPHANRTISIDFRESYVAAGVANRAYGYSVRCVQVTD